jgi:hypothetical protein
LEKFCSNQNDSVSANSFPFYDEFDVTEHC